MNKLSHQRLIKLNIGLAVLLFSLIASSKKQNVAVAIELNHQELITTNISLSSSTFPDPADQQKYQTIINHATANDLANTSMGNIIQQVSRQFLGAKYQAGLLDKSPQETLIISLQQFDCLLFLETVMAIARNIQQHNYGYQTFSQNIENQRYWNGKMNGYCSRLHYFSDWIEDNQRRGNIQNITRQLGGIYIVKKLNFMTTHRSSYPNLVKSNANFKCISSVEASLSDNFNYIPTKNIRQVYSQLQPGDIIGVATNIAGLDFTHTGFVYQHANGKIGLIHASPAGKVVIAQDLQQYVSQVNNAIGIVVSRANK